MPLFILSETSCGYGLFKASDSKLLKRDNLHEDLEDVANLSSLLKLKQFQKFDSAAVAVAEAASLTEGKVSTSLATLLNTLKDEKKASLAVADPKLGNAIGKLPGLELQAISNASTNDLFRAIREHLPSLISGITPQDINTMSLGLSHSLSRHKLKFSAHKIDQMIISAVSLIDDIDKELNVYAMRVKEWMGWHFPELAKILNDNYAYARVVCTMGMRSNAKNCDLTEILPEEIAEAVRNAAEISMGSEITEDDLENIQGLADQVVELSEYRKQLSTYLANRMQAVAPNLTALVGELIGARLIAHSGSLMNLAKSPGSTIQILGAEKALFRALKSKSDTPKYGLLYHASLVGQASGKNKGKVSRMLASKAALGLRVDALADMSVEDGGAGGIPEEERGAIGTAHRITIERRLAKLEGKPLRPKGVSIAPGGQSSSSQPGKWEVKEARKYNSEADGISANAPATKPTTNGVLHGETKLIEEMDGEEVRAEAGAADEDEDESMDDDDEDDEDEPKSSSKPIAASTNGSKAESKAEKAKRKEEKRLRKAARQEKRDKKAAKKAAKEAKAAGKDTAAPADAESSKKKRKREEGEGEKLEKKKKKKSKE